MPHKDRDERNRYLREWKRRWREANPQQSRMQQREYSRRRREAKGPKPPRVFTCRDCGAQGEAAAKGVLPMRCVECRREAQNAARRRPVDRRKWARWKVLRRKFRQHLRAPGKRWCSVCNQLHDASDNRWDACELQRRRRVRAGNASSQKRRAIKRSTQVEHIDRIEVFERDGWRCQRLGCGKKVNDEVRAGHPLKAELGHVVALAAGGTHTRGNVVCLCFTCNREDGVNRAPIQFVMEV